VRALTSERVGHLPTRQVRGDLDRLLVHDAGLGMTRLTWLTTPAVEATSAAVKMAIEKLLFLRGMDAHHLDNSMLPRERRRFLATLGRRSTVQGLERRGERRYPILLALVAQSAVDQLDEVIALFDQAVSARESRAEEARVEPGSLRGLRVVATPAPVTPEDLAVLQTDVLVGYVFAQAAAGSARPGRRRAARETRVRIRRSRRPRLDPLADRHPPIVPAAFRKLDAVVVLTARLLPGTPTPWGQCPAGGPGG
jgi:hypothetical protein